MNRTLIVVLSLSFLFPVGVSAQDAIFPSDIAGFRFGADLEEISAVCRAGEVIEGDYVCHEPGLNFRSDLIVHFSSEGYATSIVIRSPRLGRAAEARRLHGMMLEQMTATFGEPSDLTENNQLSWSFYNGGTALLGMGILDFTHGYFELQFNSGR
jgi:hypothetical protein